MKISLNSIKEILKENAKSFYEGIPSNDEIISRIGNQLGAIEGLNSLDKKYSGLKIVRVEEVSDHPNADKLKICLINDNNAFNDVPRDNKNLVQVVCGAPNVKLGMIVVWIPPSKVIPESLKKVPLVVSEKDIRGIKSYGMLASAKELDLGDDHEGLLEVDNTKEIGTDFDEAFSLKDDVIIELENKMFTHRPDCFGYLGIAREVAGIFNQPFISPSWYSLQESMASPEEDIGLNLVNELPSQVKRICLKVIKDIEVGPSPTWLQIELIKAGLRPINNIVDLTNYYMIYSSQPLHAYDYDKVKTLSESTPTLVVRNPKPNEKLTLLNGKVIEPDSSDIMIATDKKLIGMGGVMGGSETEVDKNTKNIIVECANFDMYAIRRSAMKHGLFSDAVTRFTKGQSPLQNLVVINRFSQDVIKIAKGQIATQVIDNNHLEQGILQRGSVHPPIKITRDFINVRLNLNLDLKTIESLLKNVECKVKIEEQYLEVTAPFWRTDIELREDVVEEIGRLHGFDKLPLKLPTRDLSPAKLNPVIFAKDIIRSYLAKLGANEVLTYSFISGNLMDKVGQDSTFAFSLANALSPELQFYRLSLVPSLLEKVHLNIKAGYNQFAIFEIGKSHNLNDKDEDSLPKELEVTAFVTASNDQLKNTNSAYYLSKKYLDYLCGENQLNYQPLEDHPEIKNLISPYQPNRSALVYVRESNELLGVIGEFRPTVSRNLKLPKFCSGFEVDSNLLGKLITMSPKYLSLPKYPKIVQDISLKVKFDNSFASIADILTLAVDKNKPTDCTVNLTPLDIYQADDDTTTKNITFRIKISSYNKTLTDIEVNQVLDQAAEDIEKQIGAVRI